MIKQLTNLSHTMECKCYECQIVDKINELVRAHNETGGECTCNVNLHSSLKDVLEAEKTCEVHKPTLKPQEGWEEEFDVEYEKYNNVFKPPEKWKQFIKEFVRDKFIERKKVEEAIEEEAKTYLGSNTPDLISALSDLKERLL